VNVADVRKANHAHVRWRRNCRGRVW
jgi:hypothetical protein